MLRPGETHDTTPNNEIYRLSEILTLTAPIILEIDATGVIRFASGYRLESLSVPTHTIVGKNLSDVVCLNQENLKTLRSVLDGRHGVTELTIGNCQFELRFTPDLDETGAVTRATILFFDTDRGQLATSPSLQAKFSFREIIESTPDAVFVHRLGKVVYVNEATRRLLRHTTVGTLIGTPIVSLFSKKDRSRLESQIHDVEAATESSVHRYQLVRDDGDVGTFEITTMSVQYDGDNAIAHIARDVTQTLRMQQNLAQTERLASLGTLAGGVGHEINNPLAYMTANLSYIAEELADKLPPESSEENQDLHNALFDVRDGTDRVRDIVRQLNEFNKVDASTEKRIDPRAAIETAIRMSWNHLRRHARVETYLHNVSLVQGNQARLGQVFLALLLNATQAFTDRPIVECGITVHCSEQDDEVLVDISDNGPGMSEEIIAKIFDPFFTTRDGTGLGLSVAHSIITEMNGTIDVESQCDQGTRFRIRLPQAHPPPQVSHRCKNVLIITNEVRFLESAQIALRGHRLQLAGQLSVANTDVTANRYDAILCDVNCADIDITRFGTSANRVTDHLLFIAPPGASITAAETNLASIVLRKPISGNTLAMQLDALWNSSRPLA